MRETRLIGAYERKALARIKEKARRKYDPRHIFYEAILSSETYEEYYRKVGGEKVRPVTFTSGPVSAHMEIRYARLRGWVADR